MQTAGTSSTRHVFDCLERELISLLWLDDRAPLWK
jgi:hypothetical protein